MNPDEEVLAKIEQIKQGGPERYRQRAKAEGRLLVRERLARLLDPGCGVEDGIFADAADEGNPADAVITGIGKIHGRTICYMANDPTVKAGSWGPKTVEKILRIQETAANLRVPLLYLVDSAGARITHQVEMFPGRRHAGRIFYNEVMLSGSGAAGLPALWALCRWRRIHPSLLRSCGHGRRPRQHVFGLTAYG